MARVTVEDCLKKISNPFELVLLAAKRARILENGEDKSMIENDKDKSKDKPAVTALREIAAGVYPLPATAAPEGNE